MVDTCTTPVDHNWLHVRGYPAVRGRKLIDALSFLLVNIGKHVWDIFEPFIWSTLCHPLPRPMGPDTSWYDIIHHHSQVWLCTPHCSDGWCFEHPGWEVASTAVPRTSSTLCSEGLAFRISLLLFAADLSAWIVTLGIQEIMFATCVLHWSVSLREEHP